MGARIHFLNQFVWNPYAGFSSYYFDPFFLVPKISIKKHIFDTQGVLNPGSFLYYLFF